MEVAEQQYLYQQTQQPAAKTGQLKANPDLAAPRAGAPTGSYRGLWLGAARVILVGLRLDVHTVFHYGLKIPVALAPASFGSPLKMADAMVAVRGSPDSCKGTGHGMKRSLSG